MPRREIWHAVLRYPRKQGDQYTELLRYSMIGKLWSLRKCSKIFSTHPTTPINNYQLFHIFLIMATSRTSSFLFLPKLQTEWNLLNEVTFDIWLGREKRSLQHIALYYNTLRWRVTLHRYLEKIFAYTIDSRYKVARITKKCARVCNNAELMAATRCALTVDANADNNWRTLANTPKYTRRGEQWLTRTASRRS